MVKSLKRNLLLAGAGGLAAIMGWSILHEKEQKHVNLEPIVRTENVEEAPLFNENLKFGEPESIEFEAQDVGAEPEKTVPETTGHKFIANVYDFGLSPLMSEISFTKSREQAPVELEVIEDLVDERGNTFDRFVFSGLSNGLYDMNINYPSNRGDLEAIVLKGGPVIDEVVIHEGDSEKWYQLSALKEIKGKIYDKDTVVIGVNSVIIPQDYVTSGKLRFVSRYDSNIQFETDLTESGFEVMVPIMPALEGTRNAQYRIYGTFEGTDYAAKRWITELDDNMLLGTVRGLNLGVIVVDQTNGGKLEGAEVYLLDQSGKILTSSHKNPEISDKDGFVSFRGVDPKSDSMMVFVDYENNLNGERIKLYQSNLEDLREIRLKKDGNETLIAQMSPLRGELEVIVDGIYDDEEVRLEFWPGFKYANGDFSPLHVNSPIKEAWEPEPIENGGRKFFIPYGDFSVVGILEGQFPEFDIFNIPRDNSAYLDFSGTSVIEGVVYDPYGNVLGNQKVQLGRDINGGRKFIDAVTDGNGMFYFDRLKEGSFNVSSFFGPTMYSAQQNLDIEDGTITTVELQFEGLESIMGQAYGMDSVNGAIPLKNLKIEYCVGSSDNFGRYGQQFLLGFEGTKHLDEQGRFNFWHDPSIEKWGFKVTSPGYFPVTLESLKDLEHIVLEKEK